MQLSKATIACQIVCFYKTSDIEALITDCLDRVTTFSLSQIALCLLSSVKTEYNWLQGNWWWMNVGENALFRCSICTQLWDFLLLGEKSFPFSNSRMITYWRKYNRLTLCYYFISNCQKDRPDALTAYLCRGWTWLETDFNLTRCNTIIFQSFIISIWFYKLLLNFGSIFSNCHACEYYLDKTKRHN